MSESIGWWYQQVHYIINRLLYWNLGLVCVVGCCLLSCLLPIFCYLNFHEVHTLLCSIFSYYCQGIPLAVCTRRCWKIIPRFALAVICGEFDKLRVVYLGLAWGDDLLPTMFLVGVPLDQNTISPIVSAKLPKLKLTTTEFNMDWGMPELSSNSLLGLEFRAEDGDACNLFVHNLITLYNNE